MTTTATFLNLTSLVIRKSSWFLALAAIPKQSEPERAVVAEPESESDFASASASDDDDDDDDDDSKNDLFLFRSRVGLGWSSSLLSLPSLKSECGLISEESESSSLEGL